MIEDKLIIGQIIPDDEIIKSSFLSWQCCLREQTLRQSEGRVVSGMYPRVTVPGLDFCEQIIVQLRKKNPSKFIAEFQSVAQKNYLPSERSQIAIEILLAKYYLEPSSFFAQLTALFSEGSSIAEVLLKEGCCVLYFEQRGRYFDMPCRVFEMLETSIDYQAAYWYHSMFNTELSNRIRVLYFEPNWAQVECC